MKGNIMKKNIMLIIGQLKNGGAERSITNLANELIKYHNVILVTANAQNKDYICKVPVIEMKELQGWRKILGILKIRQLKKQNKIDVCISYITLYNFYNVISHYKEKTIISIRNHLTTKNEKRLEKLCHKISIKLANKIVCCSKSVAYDQIHNFKCNPKKVVVIENFCNELQILEDRQKEPKESLSNNLIVTMGRLVEHKGHIEIIKAMVDVVKKVPDSQLLILGRGPLKEKLLALIKANNLENNVYLMDFQKNPYQYIYRAKAFVLASDFEGFPNVIIEAMACGAPIIATDAPGGAKEILSDNYYEDKGVTKMTQAKYGILISKENKERDLVKALLLLLNNKSKYKYYQQKSLERIKTFNKDIIMEKWKKIILEGDKNN